MTKKLTKNEVIARVTAIRALKSDDEAAHAAEDSLYRDVLVAIAAGNAEEPVGVARIALGTQRIKFKRHCA